MRISFIIPNAPEVIRSIPLGLLYLASYLKGHGHTDVTIIDARHERLDHRGLANRLKGLSPDLVGISGMSMESSEVHRLAGLAKESNKKCKVVVGGPYATSSPEYIMRDQNIDFAVIGEGERTMVKLADSLGNGNDFSQISGLAYRKNQSCVVNPAAEMIEDLDSLPFPAWDLIDIKGYFSRFKHHSETPFPSSRNIAPLFTSRGCPYQCTYCHNIFGKKIRFRSVRNVIREIEILVNDYGVKEIEIIDDCFNFDIPRAKEICDEIIRRKIKVAISFPNALRVDRMDEELILKLKQAGTHVIFYAIESASPRIQKNIRKNLNLDRARQIIARTIQEGIITCGYFMLGFPTETKEEMLQTIRFAKEEGFHIINMFFVTAPPNTVMFNEMFGKSSEGANVKINRYQKLSYNKSAVSDRELRCIWSRGHREFYLRPRQIWRIWRAVPDKRILLRNGLVVFIRALAGR